MRHTIVILSVIVASLFNAIGQEANRVSTNEQLNSSASQSNSQDLSKPIATPTPTQQQSVTSLNTPNQSAVEVNIFTILKTILRTVF